MKRRTLLLSPFFHPELISTGRYNTYLAKELLAEGDDVIVGCSFPLYPDWMPSRVDDDLDGVRTIRGGSWMRYPRAPMGRRLALELWFAAHSLVVAWRLRNQLDRVIAVFPPSLFFYLLRWFLPRRVARIGIVHDLQGMLGLTGDRVVARWIGYLVQHVETKGFQACDRLVLLSHSMMRHVVDNYGINPSKCIVSYPFFTEICDVGDGTALADILEEGYVHIVYSGAMGDKQNPSGLLALYETIVSTRCDVVCHIFSRGPLMEEIQSRCDARFKNRIRFHDLVEERDLSELYARSTIQIIPQKSGTSAGAFPSKLPNLMVAGVPIFAITDAGSELESLLLSSGIGCVCNSWQDNVLLPKLSAFVDEVSKMTRAETKAKASELVRIHFLVAATVNHLE